MDDSFIRSYIGELLRSLRTQYLIDLIKPYSRLELSFLARQLNVEKDEVEELLIELILEGKVEGKIDQVAMRLELDRKFVPLLSSFYSVLAYRSWFIGKLSRKDDTALWTNGRRRSSLPIRLLLGRIPRAWQGRWNIQSIWASLGQWQPTLTDSELRLFCCRICECFHDLCKPCMMCDE